MNNRNHWYAIIATIFILCIGFTSCDKDDSDEMSQFSSLFYKTDYFIDMLDEVYEHYDALGKKETDSSDGKYTITPMGRLIIVKKKTYASDVSYENIKDALKKHYDKNSKVKDVFLNSGGTITIDCRK